MNPQDNDSSPEFDIEAPPGLLPDLGAWGIEEYEKGVCLDSVENRQVIRSNKARWNVIFDREGQPTEYIQVVTAEMHQAAQGYSKSNLLSDPDDFNSEYLSGLKLILAPDAEMIAPTWVLKLTRTYMAQQEEKRNLPEADQALLQSRLIDVPTRCTKIKADGTRCWLWCNGAKESLGMCPTHARRVRRNTMQSGLSVQQAARNRILSAQSYAADRLEALMDSDDPRIALQAVNSMLDRGGNRGIIEVKEEVTLHATDAAKEVTDRLAKLREGQQKRVEMMRQIRANAETEDVVDAEVVPDNE